MMMPDEICRHLREAAAAIRSVRNGESRDHLGEIHAQACESGAAEIEKLSDMLAADLQIEDYVKVKQERAEALSKLETSQVALKGAEERAKMLLDAKSHWAERARTAESRLDAVLACLSKIAANTLDPVIEMHVVAAVRAANGIVVEIPGQFNALLDGHVCKHGVNVSQMRCVQCDPLGSLGRV